MPRPIRNRTFVVRMNDDEYRTLEENARIYGLSKAEFFRFLAVKEHARRIPNPSTFARLRADISGCANNYNQALRGLNRAIKIYQESSDDKEVADSLNSLKKSTIGLAKLLENKSVQLDQILKQYRK